MRWRWAIRLAAWLVPRAQRREWRRKWESSVENWWALLEERQELTPRAAAQVRRYVRTAFSDALHLRVRPDRIRKFLRGPAAVFAAAGVFLLVVAAASSGFSGLRDYWRELPYRNPDQLIHSFQRDAFGHPYGLPTRIVRLWRERNQTLEGLAAFWVSLRPVQLAGRDVNAARVTGNFFDLLGARAARGRTFLPADDPTMQIPLVISHRAWQRLFGSDPGVIGKPVQLGGRPAAIIGVMPERFWAVSPAIEVWGLYRMETLGRPWLVHVLARLQPGVAVSRARTELLDLARAERVRWMGEAPDLHWVSDQPLLAPWTSLGLAISAGLVLGFVLLQCARFALRRQERQFHWHYSAFLVAKSFAFLLVLTLAWIEITSYVERAHGGLYRDVLLTVGLGWVVFVGCGGLLWWLFRDQFRRCPVCLHRLSMPVTIGSWSSSLEPVSTEFLCERGHGSLCVPETESSASEPDRWTELDDSWRELFTK
jgi:hypothetical protein